MKPTHSYPTVMQVITKGELGGAQTHVLALCEALAGQARLVVVIGGTEPAPPLALGLQALNLPVLRAPALGNSLAPWRIARAVWQLVPLIRTHRPDVLHAHSAAAGVAARIAGRLCGTPVVYTVHGFAFKPEAPWPRRSVAWCAEWLLARWTGHMVCVSEYERRLARRLPLAPERISVVLNAMPDSPHRAQPAGTARIIMVARLAAPKRADLLLQALARLRDALGHEAPASLVGDGPERPALQALAQRLGLQAMDFAGNASDVPERLAAHGIFALLSDHEGLPISVIEAMRAGLAIVGSDLPGLRELLPSGQHGVLTPNTPEAIAQALERLVRDPALRGRLGQAARARYEQHHAPEPMASAILAIYAQV